MDANRISLERLPLRQGSGEIEEVHRSYAAQLAKILNADRELPPEFRLPPDVPKLTSEGVVSFVDSWCRKRNAMFFFIILDGDVVAGTISLSHIDREARTAKTGYFLATRFQSIGIGTQAFSLMLDIAGSHGLQQISGSVPKTNIASRKLWESCGATVGVAEDEVTLDLANCGGKVS